MERRNDERTGVSGAGGAGVSATAAAALFGGAPARRQAPLTGSILDRAAHLRDAPEARAARLAEPGVRALPLWQGKPAIRLISGRAALDWRAPAELDGVDDAAERVFLGFDAGAGRLAADLSALEEAAAAAWLDPSGEGCAKFIDLRSIGPDLAGSDAAIVAQAKSLTDWSRAHRFCARCGAPTRQAQGGWRRDCSACDGKHFPRTDPVVIMLTVRRGPDGVERVLLGRQHGWPAGLHSLLAGYVEPGESFEEAARREVLEESGVPVGQVTFIASQPWPFPSTLMIGVFAEALADKITPDPAELEAALWASREEIRAALVGEHPTLTAPRRDAIARMLVEAWATGALDG